MSIINDSKKVHFIGIGGIGVSSVARMMILEGKHVSGSDITKSEITSELEKLGAKFFVGQSFNMIPKDVDLIIYSPAVVVYDPKLLEQIEKKKIPALSYPETLGVISKDFYTIAISGTHGKTTTTGMTTKVFSDAGLEPTAIIGSLMKDFQGNFVAGTGKYFIVEACEYRRSFLNLNPKILAITNIDNDHLDYYKNMKGIQKGFSEMISKIPKDGYLICNKNNKTIKPVLKFAKCKIIDYTKTKEQFKLKFPGQHNIENAEVAYAIGKIVGISDTKIKKALEDFNGTWRRFEYKGETKNGALIYDEYSHHPTEIQMSLKGFKEKFPKQKIIVVFQPHLFSRTKLLLNDFAKSFKNADHVLLAPIYASREKADRSINANILAEKIRKSGTHVTSFADFKSIHDFLRKKNKKGDIIVTMGAGDIYKIGEGLILK